jgi:hypothetical protein
MRISMGSRQYGRYSCSVLTFSSVSTVQRLQAIFLGLHALHKLNHKGFVLAVNYPSTALDCYQIQQQSLLVI